MARKLDLAHHIGRQFGMLTVTGLGYIGHVKDGRKVPRMYECTCVCGSVIHVPMSSLTSGNTKACGCIRRSANGLGNTAEYKIWREMHRRCGSVSHPRYPEWGGRGITVCEEWSDFDTFIVDMGVRPSTNHSIERVDNDGGYNKDNCYWATPVEQNNNKSSNRQLTLRGVTKTMAQWCSELGLNYNTIRSRVYILGWSDEKALTTPTRGGAKNV